MLVTYRNNYHLPPIIISLTLILFYFLVDPSVNNTGLLTIWHAAPPLSTAAPEIYSPPPSNTASKYPDESTSKPKSNHLSQPTPSTLKPEDVLLILKTGSSVLYRRVPIHLTTTLSPLRIPRDNTVLYSDSIETLGSHTTIDILSHLSPSILSSTSDFELYNQIPLYNAYNHYSELNNLPGDDDSLAGGWKLDKWKFLPLMSDAGKSWAGVKWYLYMEDDTYLFLPNILHYLSAFNPLEPHYLGRFAFKGDVSFAHGGSGFALSRGGWEKSFGANKNLAREMEGFTGKHCCGDHVLGYALREAGVRFGENGVGKFSWGWNNDVHWKFPFTRENWCSIILSWHKAHSRDVARYYALEQSWDFKKGPLLHRDIYTSLILPTLSPRIEWWDNLSSLFTIESSTANEFKGPESLYSTSAWQLSWQSVEECEKACISWKECVQWKYYEDKCSMDDRVIMGSGIIEGMVQRKTNIITISGWLKERVEGWRCNA